MASSGLSTIDKILAFEVFRKEHDGVNHGFSVQLSNGDIDDVQANDPRLTREMVGTFLEKQNRAQVRKWIGVAKSIDYDVGKNRPKDECITKLMMWFDEVQGSVSSLNKGGQGCVSLPNTTAIPVLLQELTGGKELWVPCIAFVSKDVNADQTRNIALAQYMEAGFETKDGNFLYYGNPIRNWQCSVSNDNIACVTNNENDKAERAHVVFPHQITKVVSLSPTCIVEVQGGNQIPVDPCFIHVPGFFHVDGDRDKPYLFTDLSGSTSYQEEYVRLRNLWEESANSEVNHGHALGGMLQQDLSAAGRDCIDLTIDSPDRNAKRPAPIATGNRLALPLHDLRAAAKPTAPPAIDASVSPVHKHAEQSRRDRSTGLPDGGEWNILNPHPTQHDVIQPGDSTPNNNIGQSPALDEPLARTTNPNNFGPDPADGSPEHCELSLDSQQVLSALGRNGRFKVITRPHLVNEAYSSGTSISSICVFIQVSTDKPGMPHLLTFGAIRRINKDGLADFFKHWLRENCCKKLVDAYWALSEHVDSDIEERSTRSGYDGDEDEMSSPLAGSFSAQPGILRDNDETGRSPGGSPTTPRCPSDKALDYMLGHARKAAEHCNVGAINALNTIAIEAGMEPIYPTHKFDFGTPTELPRQEVGDMSSKELQERLDAVEKNKALLQGALHESEEEAARLKEEVDERNVKQEAAKKIQALFLGARDRRWRQHLADEQKAAELAAATNIQALFRGASDRKLRQQKAAELAATIKIQAVARRRLACKFCQELQEVMEEVHAAEEAARAARRRRMEIMNREPKRRKFQAPKADSKAKRQFDDI